MKDIRKRLRMLADNAQRSEIVEDAIRLIDRLEGRVNMDLPIKVLSRDDVQIYRLLTKRSTIEEILCMMDEFQEPISSKQVPEETVSSPAHQQWLRDRQKQDPLNPQPIEEPKKWEPGMVLRGCSEIYRLDVFSKLGGDKQSEIWDFTDMHTGESLTGGAFPYLLYEIYRLPHEFKVGDWAQWIDHTPGPFQVMNVQAVDGRETLYGFGAFLPAEECRHVPPPKEEKPSQERQVMPNGDRSTRRSRKSDSTNSAVTGAHRAGKTSERFSGPHWFSEANRTRCESTQGFNHQLSAWSTSDWFTALLGELEEAANNAKKLNRVRDGIPGNEEHTEELKKMLRKKLGDVFVYLDLLCQSLGFYALDAAIEVFDEKSKKIGYPCDLKDAWLEKEGEG